MVAIKQDDNADRLRRRILLWSMGVAVLVLTVIWWPGCRQYPPATSIEAYTLMEALYTACNTKNAASLDKIEQWVNRDLDEGKIGPAEKDAFARIIGMAKSGNWQAATKAAFRFSQDQVGQGRLFPKSEKPRRGHDDRGKQ